MNSKILFMIINNEVKYLQNSNMDHREWYQSLGLDQNNFSNIVRGFILDNKIVFYKGENFSYDEEVMNSAKMFAPTIKLALNNLNLEVYCGVTINGYGSKWEPIVKINDTELTGIIKEKKEKVKEKKEIELQPILDFENNINDENFIKNAKKITIIILVLTIVSKVLLLTSKTFHLNSFIDIVLLIGQISFLIVTLIKYNKKHETAKYFGVAASACLFLTFNLFDIVLGAVYLLFTINQKYITTVLEKLKKK